MFTEIFYKNSVFLDINQECKQFAYTLDRKNKQTQINGNQ